jgi:hypothetical protein
MRHQDLQFENNLLNSPEIVITLSDKDKNKFQKHRKRHFQLQNFGLGFLQGFLKVIKVTLEEEPDFPIVQNLVAGMVGMTDPVDLKTYRKRREICEACPVYDFRNKRCWNELAKVGCKCYVPLKAWVPDACFGWAELGDGLGWPEKFQRKNGMDV